MSMFTKAAERPLSTFDRLRPMLVGYGLRPVTGPEPTWHGVADGVPIRIIATPGHGGATRVRFELSLPAERESLLVIAATHVPSFEGAVRTGDASFDDGTYVSTNDISLLGCFDAPTRALTAQLTAIGAFVSAGVLRFDNALLPDPQTADLALILGRLLRLAQRLCLDQVNHELVQIARTDPDLQVRAVFEFLLANRASRDADGVERVRAEVDSEDTAFARLVARLHDPGSGRSVRLEAGMRLIALFPLARIQRDLMVIAADLVAPIVERLSQLMREFGDQDPPDRARLEIGAGVLVELANRHPKLDSVTLGQMLEALALVPDLVPFDLVLRGCENKRTAVVMCALDLLHSRGEPAAAVMPHLSLTARANLQPQLPTFARSHPEYGAGLLIEFFERMDPRNVTPCITYLQAIAATGDARVGPRLVPHLESPYEDVQLAVIVALGSVGDLSAVSALKPLTEGLFRAAHLKGAARSAIEAIRAREGARSLPGALSLAEGAGAGGLSLPDPD